MPTGAGRLALNALREHMPHHPTLRLYVSRILIDPGFNQPLDVYAAQAPADFHALDPDTPPTTEGYVALLDRMEHYSGPNLFAMLSRRAANPPHDRGEPLTEGRQQLRDAKDETSAVLASAIARHRRAAHDDAELYDTLDACRRMVINAYAEALRDAEGR